MFCKGQDVVFIITQTVVLESSSLLAISLNVVHCLNVCCAPVSFFKGFCMEHLHTAISFVIATSVDKLSVYLGKGIGLIQAFRRRLHLQSLPVSDTNAHRSLPNVQTFLRK